MTPAHKIETPPLPPPEDHGAPAERKSRAGRRPGAVWEFFTPLKTEQNKTHATCKFCGRRCAGVAARMTMHVLKKCPAAPPRAVEALAAAVAQEPLQKRQRLVLDDAGNGTGNTSAVVGMAAFSAAEGLDATKGHLRTATGASASRGAIQTVKAALQKLIVACLRQQAPLRLVEDAFFKDALAMLSPAVASMDPKSLTVESLLEDAIATVTREETEWVAGTDNLTILFTPGREWRGVDSKRHRMLFASSPDEAEPTLADIRAFMLTQTMRTRKDAIVGVCSDSDALYHALFSSDGAEFPVPRVPLRSRCLLRSTMQLWKLVLDAVPQVLTVILSATEVAQSLSMAVATEAQPQLRLLDGIDLDWSLPLVLLQRLLAIGNALSLHDKMATHSGFFKDLGGVCVLLEPFSWLLTLSESDQMCSSQFVLLFVFLLTRIQSSSLLTAEQVESLSALVMSRLSDALEDHHLVALLLDPRVHGVGLSPTGLRKAKSLVVQVASRILSMDADTPENAISRQRLLVQLGHYLDKSAYFGDEIVWEMARGAPGDRFWRDYAQDAPELCMVATSVLRFTPHSAFTSEFFAGVSTPSAVTESFDERRLKFHFENNGKRSDHDMEAVLAKFGRLLLSAAAALPDDMAHLSHREDPAIVSATITELVQRLCETGSSSGSTTPRSPIVDASWFGFQTPAEQQQVAETIKNFLSSAFVLRSASSSPAEPIASAASDETDVVAV